MRIRVPDTSSSSGSELSDGGDSPVATTPEAFTDSDNDSSFGSEYEEEAAATCGSNSGMLMEAMCRWPECTADMGSSHEGHHRPQQQQKQLEAPRPLRKVRFTLGGRESAKAAAPSCWGKEQRAVIQENALRSLGMLRPAESAAPLAQQRRRWQRKQKSSRSSSGSATRAASKNRALAPAPFKSTSANTSSTAVAHKTTTTTTSPFPSIPTPASPKKKRKVSTWSSPSSHRVNVRTSGTSGTGGGGGDSHRRPTRPSPSTGKVAVAMAVAAGKNGRVTSTTTTTSELTVEAAATAALRANGASSARLVPCATTAANSVSVPPPAATPMDLSCTEDVDMDAAMKPGGEGWRATRRPGAGGGLGAATPRATSRRLF
ncbi:hypothetical protein Esi_0021_0148 [Ectocarpus siliculosus]|uniref:Uncharacterized protein n=1 Tax=Ectocarpus siliculosus TaxID=2880 RepID=D7FR04_ECTSI|nr:hypothetical protein Esi_0021_0148 [Ectocarpus siliculosus]|eukprot:CBJ26158.1 hypothetical protein Esi_0021_0148 [Ectocarpus siliculosus]